MAKKRIKDLNTKLAEVDRERKSGKATPVGVKKQSEDQRQQLHRTKDQFAITKEQIEPQKKELEKVEEATAQAEQNGYDIGVKEIEETLRAQVTRVCWGYCLQVWTKALNLFGVGVSSKLRKTENIFYP